MRGGEGTRRDGVVLTLLFVAGMLLLANLDSGYLWQDEAETAVLARNTLHAGYPSAFDGRSLIDEPLGYGPHHAWIYSPWLPFYLLAGVFAVAGQSTWVARLPFALLGWLAIYLTWRLACRLTRERRIQRLSVALLVCSVPFLLHMRQCRYYAPTTVLLLASGLSYLAFCAQPSGKRAMLLGLVLVLLFHTNFGTWLPTVGAIALHHLVWGDRSVGKMLLLTGVVVAGLTIPWALFFYRSGFVGAWSMSRTWRHLEYYVRVTNKYLLPLAAMAVLSLSQRVLSVFNSSVTRSPLAFLILLVTAQVAFLLLIPNQRHLRYLIPTLPLLVVGEAWWLAGWPARSRGLGGVFTAIVLFTNVLQSLQFQVPLVPYLGELTHRYTGPMEGIVGYLREHAQRGETVKIPYDDRTLIFYTDLRVENPSRFLVESYPEWVVIRRDWIPGDFFQSDYFHRIEASYDRIELEAPDILWQNREDPGSHHFRTVRDAPRVVIYRKRNTPRGPAIN